MDRQVIQESDFLLYWGEDGKVHAQVILGSETVWASQATLSDIFGIDRTGIGRHINNILQEGELDEKSNVQFLHVANSDKPVGFYSLDMIIAVGYRTNSYKATRFRQWATRILKEYLVKGFAMDDERLKQGNELFGKDYFRELLERIREIRASEKMFYEKIRDYYATSIDYDKNDPRIPLFFAQAQNKLEFAVIGKTSAEIIKSRGDASQPNMGLKTFKNINRDGVITKGDTIVAKNYLTKEELSNLNLLVTMFLDYIESFISRTNKPMKMADWEQRLDAFLQFNEYEILKGHGKISKKVAEAHAEKEFEKYKKFVHKEPNTSFGNTFSSIIKTRELPSEKLQDESISEFDQKADTSRDTTPSTPSVANMPAKRGRKPKPKTKECPRCGKVLDVNAMYCDGTIEFQDDWVNCGFVF